MEERKRPFLAEGTRRSHLGTFYFAAYATILLAVTYGTLLPYLLSTFLGLPVSRHGAAVGNVGLVGEMVLFACIGAWGALSDRVGRRAVYVGGFVILAVAFAVTPLSRSMPTLLLTRTLFSVGIGATIGMLAIIMADYVVNERRGTATAIMGVMNGLGAATAAMFVSRLPRWFGQAGQSGVEAGFSTYFLAAGACLVVAVILRFGLRPGGDVQQRPERMPMGKAAREAIAAARAPGIALSYAAAFVSRADLAVAGFFFPAWLTRHHVLALGENATQSQMDMATAQGIAAGGALVAIAGGGGLLFAPVIGLLCDRIDRVTALIIALGVNVVGYGLAFAVTDPTGGFIKVIALVIGFGQIGGIIASQVLIQEQAPAARRGVVVGAFSTCGALGIMVCLWVGGQLFDGWTEAGPFTLLASLNALVVVAALLLRKRIAQDAAARAAREGRERVV